MIRFTKANLILSLSHFIRSRAGKERQVIGLTMGSAADDACTQTLLQTREQGSGLETETRLMYVLTTYFLSSLPADRKSATNAYGYLFVQGCSSDRNGKMSGNT
jgi:hypothetical protein